MQTRVYLEEAEPMVCSKCFAEIPDTSVFCLECGARLREDTLDPLYAEGSDREVYPDIARANLLRIKGRYEEAVDVCLGILKRYPSNETAHALLGDIYADQGKLADAIQWYELLVDLSPNNALYRAKLDNLRSLQAAQQAPPAAMTPPPPAQAPSTRTWVYGLFGLITLILILSAFMAGRRWSLMGTDSPPAINKNPATAATEPPRIPPPPLVSQSSTTERPSEPENSILTFSGMSASEEQLARAISQRLNNMPVWCHFDPLLNRWAVRARIQAGALTRTRVMQEALQVAFAAFEQSPSLQSLVVIMLVPGTEGGDTLLMAAEFARATLPVSLQGLTEQQIEAIFQSVRVWWNPAVPLAAPSPTGVAPSPSNPAPR
jgi:tetratricopeptide (TPR) repeat protein